MRILIESDDSRGMTRFFLDCKHCGFRKELDAGTAKAISIEKQLCERCGARDWEEWRI